jgi:hypothetical protein
VTDDGLKDLAGLKGLRELDLTGCRVSGAAVDVLRESLPGCRIVR